MHEVWDHYLKPIGDAVKQTISSPTFYFPANSYDLSAKSEWLSKYAKYGTIKLYPTKLVKDRLILTFLKAAEDFNSGLNQLLSASKAEGLTIELYYAFDHWGIRTFSPEERSRVDKTQLESQRAILEQVDANRKDEVTSLVVMWPNLSDRGKQIISILDAFSNENGIMLAKTHALFGGLLAVSRREIETEAPLEIVK